MTAFMNDPPAALKSIVRSNSQRRGQNWYSQDPTLANINVKGEVAVDFVERFAVLYLQGTALVRVYVRHMMETYGNIKSNDDYGKLEDMR